MTLLEEITEAARLGIPEAASFVSLDTQHTDSVAVTVHSDPIVEGVDPPYVTISINGLERLQNKSPELWQSLLDAKVANARHDLLARQRRLVAHSR